MINPQTYFRVRVKKIPSSLEAEMTAISFEHGCSGLSEALNYVQRDLVYDPEIRPQRFHDVDVYFAEKPDVTFYKALQDLNENIECQLVEEDHKDWLEEWKKGFKPFPLVGPFWVVPSWFESPKEAEIPLFIDPGMAFGTGTHATTQMAAALIHRVLKIKTYETAGDVLDVGTGTAILAMLSKIAGAKKVVGIDIDPEARRVARENISRNQVDDLDIPDLLLEEIRESYDLVVANIIDGVLLNLKNDLDRVTKSPGHLILTGILEEREGPFLDQFLSETNLKIEVRLAKDEWVGFLLSKN
jgi:ribosomal protein L11 methyltransferase